MSVPYSQEAEHIVLGAIILDNRQPNECLLQAVNLITPSDFFLDSNRCLFSAFVEIARADKPIDFGTIAEYLKSRNEIERIGGLAYISGLSSGSPRIKNVQAHCETLKKYSARRQLIHAAEIVLKESEDNLDPGEIAARLQAEIDSAVDRTQRQNCIHVGNIGPELCRQMIQDFDKPGDTVGLPTGIGRLDLASGGLCEGENIVVAGYTGGGKTAFALNVVERNCSRDIPVTFYSFELRKFDLLTRLAAKRCGIPQIRIRNKAINSGELSQLLAEIGELQRWPLWIDDRSGMTPRELYASGRMQAARGAGLFVVDYVQLLANNCPGYQIREKVNTASATVRAMAKDSKVPTLNLSQLARPNEKATPRKPTIYDLKESGNIEQDAHIVVLLWREFLEENGSSRPTGNDAVILGKNRGGPLVEIAAEYDGPLMHWREKQTNIQTRGFYEQ